MRQIPSTLNVGVIPRPSVQRSRQRGSEEHQQDGVVLRLEDGGHACGWILWD